ncbi:putative Elongator complex protein 1 [Nannochloris sp. 'desiccata']|nr:putative Elongator complex protein 1 [Chlorella desiccata (nom. nud.)]
MKNLANVAELEAELELPPEIGLVQFAVQDEENNVIYIVGNSLYVVGIDARSLAILWIADVATLAPAADCELPLDATITAAVFSPDLGTLTLGLSSGHLLLLHTSPGPSLEEVGVLEGGVVAASWSPDGEALAVLSGAGQLLLMTSTWDLLWETPVINNRPEYPQPTSLPGPGPDPGSEVQLSRNTAAMSWRGDGKYLATCTDDSFSGSGNGSVSISRVRVWDRESGELHALGESVDGVQSVLAWQPNGRHLYVAQHNIPLKDNLEKTSTSSSSGIQNIGTIRENGEAPEQQQRGAQGQAPEVRHVGAWKRELRRREEAAKAAGGTASPNQILLFERNGLQHGQFDVPHFIKSDQSNKDKVSSNDDNVVIIESLVWSPDSDVLAVVLSSCNPTATATPSLTTTTAQKTLQLWHRFNWHWYLKHERVFTDCSGLCVAWTELSSSGGDISTTSSTTSLGLRIFTAEGSVSFLSFTWECCVSSLGTAAVIDGSSVLLTPLRQSIVPPPLCAAPVACPAPVVVAALRQCCEDEALAVVLSDGRLAVVECVEEDLWEETLEEQLERKDWVKPGAPQILPRLLRLPRSLKQDVAVIRHVAWVSRHSVLVVASILPRNNAPRGDILVEVDVCAAAVQEEDVVESNNDASDLLFAKEISCLAAPGPVVSCVCCAETPGAVLQIEGGAVYGYQPLELEKLVRLPPATAFPSTCSRMLAIPSIGIDVDQGNDSYASNYGQERSPAHCFSGFSALGLNSKGGLFWGSRQLAAGVTSFTLRYQGPGGPFLLYTTRNHMLRTLPLAKAIKNALLSSASSAGQHHHQLQQQQQNQAYAIPEIKLIQQMQQQHRTAAGAAPPPQDDVTLRTIEEGSLLIASPADSVDVIYQAPRGNLETARPRALVLPAVAAALDGKDYASAWRLATVDRLDLNVLADFKWPRFLEQTVDLVNAVKSDVDIADFVAGLAPGSVTGAGGLYADALAEVLPPTNNVAGSGFFSENGNSSLHSLVAPETAPPLEDSSIPTPTSNFSIENKVVAVCEAIRAAVLELASLESETSTTSSSSCCWLRTEVTTYSKCGDLDKALKRVKQVREAELASSSSSSSFGVEDEEIKTTSTGSTNAPSPAISATAEQGLRHLLLYNLEEDVYRAALGSYELEMAYMVVTHSQRDPGEFLYQLQQFASIENESLRYHAIDMHLKRYDSALRHLMNAANSAAENGASEEKSEISEEGEKLFSQALKLAQEHNLLRLLLQFTQGKPALRCRVHIAAGEELEQRGKHEDAALAFIAANDLEKALRAYRLGGQWRQALGLAARLGREPEKIHAMAARLASDLADLHNYAHSAQILLEYCNDVSGAVAALAEGGEWNECVRVAYARGQPNLVESKIAPAAAMAASRILQNLTEDCGRIEKYSARLKELREKRAALAAAVQISSLAFDQGAAGHISNRDDDVQTEADSMISGFSIYTDATFTIKPGGSSRVGGNSSSSSASVTTVGGRRSSKKKNKGKSKSSKVRQGSPEEEAQLGRHVLSLAPLPNLCTEVGQLVEVLVMLGHEEDAATLHRNLKALIDTHTAAVEDLLTHPPLGLSLDIGAAAKEKAYETGGGIAAVVALEAAVAAVPGAELQKRAAEVELATKTTHWKWDILRDP